MSTRVKPKPTKPRAAAKCSEARPVSGRPKQPPMVAVIAGAARCNDPTAFLRKVWQDDGVDLRLRIQAADVAQRSTERAAVRATSAAGAQRIGKKEQRRHDAADAAADCYGVGVSPRLKAVK